LITLGTFPTPLPDEDFRSVLYRYHCYVKNREIADTSIELFGVRTDFTIFPRRLNQLINRLPSEQVLSTEKIIYEHTLIPYFLPFISEKHKESLFHELLEGGGLEETFVGKLAGNKYGRCISASIRYCPVCIQEDTTSYGAAYIHRKHQLAFVNICGRHMQKLITHCSECGDELKYYAVDGKCKNGHCLDKTNYPVQNELQVGICKDLEFLSQNYDRISLGIVRQKFIEQLNAKGYVSTDGKIRRKVLVQDFLTRFSGDALESVGLSKEYIIQRNTLERIVWGESLVVNLPLLFMFSRFLSGSLKELLVSDTPFSTVIPFGLGPWTCKNKYCPDFGREVIRKCVRVDNRFRGVTGKFHCNTCDSIYVKDYSWKSGERSARTFIHLSHTKEQRILDLHFEKGLTFEEIAKQLYCSLHAVKQTVRKQLLKGASEIACTKKEHGDKKRLRYRLEVESAVKEDPSLSRYQICLKHKTAYEWLKKNDRAWLEIILPPSKSLVRFDWDQIDEELSERVKVVAQQLISSNPSTRVGVYSIMSALTKTEYGRIKNYSQHLPKTLRMLREAAETKEQYQLRHLPAIVWQLRTHYGYKEVTIETIQSYRRSYRGISSEIKASIVERLADIGRKDEEIRNQ
jgi:DNA-binding CsgD family transcriptional regulator